MPLAAALGVKGGEDVEWELLNRRELYLIRKQAPAPQAKRRAKRTGMSVASCINDRLFQQNQMSRYDPARSPAPHRLPKRLGRSLGFIGQHVSRRFGGVQTALESFQKVVCENTQQCADYHWYDHSPRK
jgi:hypothetical protein